MAYFNDNERSVLAYLDATNRENAIKELQATIELEGIDDQTVELFKGVMNTLTEMSDEEYARLDFEKIKRDQRELEYEIAYDEKLVEIGVMSEDGEVLRDITPEEDAKIAAEFQQMDLKSPYNKAVFTTP